MMRARHIAGGLVLFALCAPMWAQNSNASFDPHRDASADIQQALVEAQRTGKRVLLDVGGNWCPWCHLLEEMFQQNAELMELRQRNFVTVSVYYGSDNKNERALSPYPPLAGIPHFFILESDGSLIQSKHVAELEENGVYNAVKVKEFLTQWSINSKFPMPASGAR